MFGKLRVSFEKHNFKVKTPLAASWANLGKNWATFCSKIWSLWLQRNLQDSNRQSRLLQQSHAWTNRRSVTASAHILRAWVPWQRSSWPSTTPRPPPRQPSSRRPEVCLRSTASQSIQVPASAVGRTRITFSKVRLAWPHSKLCTGQ